MKRAAASPKRGVDLVLPPDIEEAFLAVLIGVERRGEGVADPHLAHEPADRLARAIGEGRIGPQRVDQRQQFEDLRIVVEHLLEMRHEPFGVGRVAGVAAAEMIVDAARVHRLEHRAQSLAEGRIAAAEHLVPEKAEDRRIGEFGRAAEAAMDGIDRAQKRVADAGQIGRRHARPGAQFRQLRQMVGENEAAALHVVAAGAPGGIDGFEHLPERGAAPARLGRPIGAPEHRLAIGRQEHGQRPAALLAERMERGHVDVVDVRPLLAIDFNVDEQLVHPSSGFGVLERFVRHHMAPVAGGVADREQDRAVAPLGLRQGGCAPRAPVHGIIGVLQEIGRRLASEEIAAGVRLGRGPSYFHSQSFLE